MIYLDYNASTPVDRRVADVMYHSLTTTVGNPSSVDHAWGDRATATIDSARHHLAQLLNTDPRTLVFTSGATESLNLAIHGTVQHLTRQGIRPRLAVTALEHKAVLEPCQTLAQADLVDLEILPVNGQGQLDLSQLEQCCHQGPHLLCTMAANNEIGTLNPMAEIAAIARRYQIPLLCDATQALGKIPLDLAAWGGTVLLACSAHKLYGPQGCGALVVPRTYALGSLFQGGNQQRGLRPGTLNLPGIVGFGEACRLRSLEMATDEARIATLRDRLTAQLQAQIPDLVIHGDRTPRLAGTLSLSIPGIPSTALLARLRHQLACSTGSACTSGSPAPSHVLRALGLSAVHLNSALRLSLGKFTTIPELDHAATLLIQTITHIKALN
ncbi:cysteine desulfurase family protein [Prochlorothrix hollandica]|uniref:Aminotransferase n=1 Tax=Prochlorothrix hollandica PCC 9006 = CALU 1027 TaxID=317619 RepID=A0A0M2Q2H4_PROHO|nr:cysteine desulfurase family protein [Prochlorothrix hollandica]KKJ01463.1 aminotransferase [Prochlorothrix hollandica PCC 9006 = CALU 1027]